MMKKLAGVVLASVITTAFSAPLFALDLVETYELARAQDAQLMIAESQLESSRQALPQAQSGNRPQVNLSAHTTLQDKGNSLTGDDEQTSYGFTLSLAQNLYNSEIDAQIDAVEASVRQAEADYRVAELDLIVRVTEAYFNILSAQDNVEFAQAEKNAIGRQLEQAKKRFEVGLIAITGVKEAQASFDASIAQEIAATNTLDNAKEALQLIIGQPLESQLSVLGEEVALVIPEPSNRDTWVEQALKNNLSLLSAEAALQAANENRRIARAEENPTLNFIASYQDTEVDSDANGDYDADDLTLSLQFEMPLYTGGRTGGAIAEAEADYTSAQNNLLLQKRLVSQQTSTAYLAVVSGISQVQALKQALVSTTAALEATEAGFDVGTRTSVDVLDSLRVTYGSQRDYASARYDYLVNTLKLKQAAGLLTAEDLAAINQWLAR
jgi:outer membrane protein